MSVPSPTHNQVKILIPTHIYLAASLAATLLLILLLFFTISPQPSLSKPQFLTMKVHPIPSKKRNITIQFDLSDARINSSSIGSQHKKRLRRLPHIFSRVLELPFRSDADVEVEEGPGFFRFVAETEGIDCDVRTHTIEIYPGVTKIVVRPNLGPLELLPLDQLELDMWRFRLPESTRPELASAVCVDGELIVTVPKEEGDDAWEERLEFGFLFTFSSSRTDVASTIDLSFEYSRSPSALHAITCFDHGD